MQGIKQRSPKLFYQFSLNEMVPADHIYRRLEQHLNLSYLYKQTAELYGSEGQKSIDPVVFMKICLLGYFNNITSDRGLCRYCEDSISARWFLGYNIDEPLPVHSTLGRTRKLFGTDLYEQLFCQALGLCVQAGLVEGKRQAFDSGLIKANASLDSMQRKLLMEDASAYCQQVAEQNPEPGSTSRPGSAPSKQNPRPAPLIRVELASGQQHSPDKQTQGKGKDKGKAKPKRSNQTHASTSDPDARMARKPGKPTNMYYHGQISVDDQHGVITAAMADHADNEDHKALPGLMKRLKANLGAHQMHPRELLADSKYNTCTSLEHCNQQGITAFMPNPSGYKPTREGFTFDAEANHYRCSQGAILAYKGTQKRRGYLNKVYRASAKDCTTCPLREECIGGKTKKPKTLTHSSKKALYDQMHKRLQTHQGGLMQARRKGLIEPVIGNLMDHNGMKKSHARGLESADKHVLMASACFNLKKWLRCGTPKPTRKPVSAAKEAKPLAITGLSGISSPYFFSSVFTARFFSVSTI